MPGSWSSGTHGWIAGTDSSLRRSSNASPPTPSHSFSRRELVPRCVGETTSCWRSRQTSGASAKTSMNRGLPIHLNPVGNVADRVSPIGNPRLEYLPANRERIAAELRGMVERWKAAGQPLDRGCAPPLLRLGNEGSEASSGSMAIVTFWRTTGYGRPWTIRYARVSGYWGRKPRTNGSRLPSGRRSVSDLGLVKAVIPPADQDS